MGQVSLCLYFLYNETELLYLMSFVNVGKMYVGAARKDELIESEEAFNTLNNIFHFFF